MHGKEALARIWSRLVFREELRRLQFQKEVEDMNTRDTVYDIEEVVWCAGATTMVMGACNFSQSEH